MSGEPYPKDRQLDRGPKRARRFRASAAQWHVLRITKLGPCRTCDDPANNGRLHSRIELHHIVPRDYGGDDYAENLAPVCRACHELLHEREPETCRRFCSALIDSECAYAVDKLGEAVFERVYGIRYER